MEKKTKVIIIGAIIVVFLALILVFFVIKPNKDSKKMLLHCYIEMAKNDKYISSRIVELYNENNKTMYSDAVEFIKLTDDQKINNAIDLWVRMFLKGPYVDNMTYKKEDDKASLSLLIDISTLSESDQADYMENGKISPNKVKQRFESEGMICEES